MINLGACFIHIVVTYNSYIVDYNNTTLCVYFIQSYSDTHIICQPSESDNIYLIISGFLFVVCLSRTIFGNRIGAHVHLEGWKHGSKVTKLNMVCTQYRLLWLLWGARARAIAN